MGEDGKKQSMPMSPESCIHKGNSKFLTSGHPSYWCLGYGTAALSPGGRFRSDIDQMTPQIWNTISQLH